MRSFICHLTATFSCLKQLLRLFLNFDLSKPLLIIGIICHLYVSRLVMRVMNGVNKITNQCQLQEQEERLYWNSLLQK